MNKHLPSYLSSFHHDMERHMNDGKSSILDLNIFECSEDCLDYWHWGHITHCDRVGPKKHFHCLGAFWGSRGRAYTMSRTLKIKMKNDFSRELIVSPIPAHDIDRPFPLRLNNHHFRSELHFTEGKLKVWGRRPKQSMYTFLLCINRLVSKQLFFFNQLKKIHTLVATPLSRGFCNGKHSVDGYRGCHNADCLGRERCVPTCHGCPCLGPARMDTDYVLITLSSTKLLEDSTITQPDSIEPCTIWYPTGFLRSIELEYA